MSSVVGKVVAVSQNTKGVLIKGKWYPKDKNSSSLLPSVGENIELNLNNGGFYVSWRQASPPLADAKAATVSPALDQVCEKLEEALELLKKVKK